MSNTIHKQRIIVLSLLKGNTYSKGDTCKIRGTPLVETSSSIHKKNAKNKRFHHQHNEFS
jgi:hypothetical protein